MAYVGDNGKRIAPKHTSRTKPPVRNAPHHVQTPPGGDIASSGGDYGTHKAKRYTASSAFRKSVRETYASQTPARRKQVSSGASNRPGPAAAAIRHEHTTRVAANRRAAGTNTPRGNIPGFGQAQQQRRSEAVINQILAAHKRTPISTSGDTKSNLELATAQAFKATPQFARDFNTVAASAARNSQRQAPPRIAAAIANMPLASEIGSAFVTTARQVAPAVTGVIDLSKDVSKAVGTDYKPGYRNLPANLFKQAVDLPAQSVPSTYHGIIEPALRGDVKTLGKNIIDPYVKIAQHPERELQEHPLTTGLALYGPLKGASNLARTGAVKAGAIPALRPEKVFPNTPLTTGPRPVARGIVGAVSQTLRDRPIRQGKAPKEVMNPSEVRRAAHEDQAASEHIRRIDRELTAMSSRAAIGKKPTAGHILAAQNIVHDVGGIRNFRNRIEAIRQDKINQLDAARKANAPKRDIVNRRAEIEAQRRTLSSLDDFLSRKDIKDLKNTDKLPDSMRGEVEAYKALSSHLQERLGKLYGQSDRLEMRSLLPYAIENMGARHVKNGFFDTKTNKIIGKEEVKSLRKELSGDDFNERIQRVNNVFKDTEGNLVKPEAIRRHMALHGNKTDKESGLGGQLSLRQAEADVIHREAETWLKSNGVEKGLLDEGALQKLPADLYKKLTDKHQQIADLENQIHVEKGNRQGLSDPAYISQAPNRKSAASYFVATNRAQNITPSGFTGKSIVEGLGSLAHEVPTENLVRAQGLVTAAERFKQMIRDVAVRRDPREIPDEIEGTVMESEFPQVLTFKSKKDADRRAADLNDKYPDHQVQPVRISLTQAQQKEFLSDANTDTQAGELAQQAIQDALDGKDVAGGGSWALMPKDYVGEASKYMSINKPIARMIGSQFRRTVLGLSIPWMIGNYSEATIRAALERVGPRSYFTGRHVLNYLKENDPQAWRELQIRAAGGGHYGIQRSAGIYTGVEHLQDASRPVRAMADAVIKLKTNKVTGPPARGVGQVWDHWTDFVFDKVNARIESQFQTAMLGKAFREQLMSDKLRKLSKQAMNEAVENKLSLRTMDALGREVDRMYGQYSKFSPGLKRLVAHETPFIAWYRNAVNFIYKTMPRDHPIVTTLINSADSATEEWRKDKGLGLFLQGHVPYFLQGSVPTGTGSVRFRYTPFAVMGDPLGSAAGIIFPQFKSILLNLMGLDWKGDPIKGYEQNQIVGVTEAIKSLTAGLVPGYSIANRALNAKEGESAGHQARRAAGDPFLETKSPQQIKSSTGAGAPKYKVTSSGPSAGKYKLKSGKKSAGKYKVP
jgi:hypothetical protein